MQRHLPQSKNVSICYTFKKNFSKRFQLNICSFDDSVLQIFLALLSGKKLWTMRGKNGWTKCEKKLVETCVKIMQRTDEQKQLSLIWQLLMEVEGHSPNDRKNAFRLRNKNKFRISNLSNKVCSKIFSITGFCLNLHL